MALSFLKPRNPSSISCVLLLALGAGVSSCSQKDPSTEDDTVDDTAVAPDDTEDDSSGDDTLPDDTANDDTATDTDTTSDDLATDTDTAGDDPGEPDASVDDTTSDDSASDDSSSDDSSSDDSSSDDTAEPDAGSDDVPTDTTVPPPDSIPDDLIESYFPLVEGATWTYRHTKTGESVWDEVVTMTAATGDQAPGFVLVDLPNRDGEVTEQLWRWVGSSVMRLERRELVGGNLSVISTYDPGFTRFDKSWTSVGVTQEITYTRVEQEAGMAAVSETRTQSFEVLEIDASVEIDGTTYENCLLVSRTRPDTLDVGHYWFAPGIGKVKELDPDSMTMEELVAYDIP